MSFSTRTAEPIKAFLLNDTFKSLQKQTTETIKLEIIADENIIGFFKTFALMFQCFDSSVDMPGKVDLY